MAKKKLLTTRASQFVQLHHEILTSDAYLDLKPAARALLIEFCCIHAPGRNGQLSISTRNATARLKIGEKAALSAFKELESHGFIKLHKHHQPMQRKAREWRLTIYDCNGRAATDEWATWKQKNNDE